MNYYATPAELDVTLAYSFLPDTRIHVELIMTPEWQFVTRGYTLDDRGIDATVDTTGATDYADALVAYVLWMGARFSRNQFTDAFDALAEQHPEQFAL